MAAPPGDAGGDESPDLEGALVDGALDKLAGGPVKKWWARQDAPQRRAWGFLAAALALGPLGLGVLAALKALYGAQAPTGTQLEAWFWLAVITLPVFLGVGVIGYNVRHLTPAIWAGAGLLAFVSVLAVKATSVPTTLGKLYCQADLKGGRVVYAHACKQFDDWGFVNAASHARGSAPAVGAQVLATAFAYTADARGFVMAVCGAVAGFCSGYLLSRA